MEVDVKYVQLKRSDSFGFGFSVCGGSGSGLPPVIYDVVENSPAANCGELESGDVILEINSREVVSLTTKEVLKCLRLSNDLVTLKVKRDPSIKERVRRHLTGSIEMEAVWRSAPPNNECHSRSNEGAFKTISTTETNGDSSSNDENRPPSPLEAALPPPQNDMSLDPAEGLKSRSKPSQPRFETFMMTGDLIINLNAKSSNASSVQLPKSKKIDNLPFGQCSTPASPEESEYRCRGKGTKREATAFHSPVAEKKGSFNYTGGFVRTSKSEDHLQKASLTTVNIDIEDDMASSLNTLLDDRDNPANDRIVWTYNAPVSSDGRVPSSPPHTPTSPRSLSSSSSNGKTASPSKGSSPKRRAAAAHNQSEGSIHNSDGTTCSASVRTYENGQPDDQSKTDFGSELGSCVSSTEEATQPPGTDSDLSSPMENLSPGDESLPNVDWSLELECRDPVINDKLVSKVPPQSNGVVNGVEGPHNRISRADGVTNIIVDANKVCVQVYPDKLKTSESFSAFRTGTGDQAECTDATSPLSIESESTLGEVSYQELRESQDEDLPTPIQEDKMLPIHDDPARRHSTSPTTDDESDSESLHSYHYSPKAVDMPSASRLAKRLYNLEGFKKSDVSRHLSKNNEFSRVVAEEYLKFFEFTDDTLDIALRKFLKQFCLIGETQERERVLVHFSKRYLDCNPGCFKSQDAVHTLTCAIMLLNTDLHGENVGRKMTCGEFIENLSELNDGENFPKEVLKALYQAIKTTPLEWAVDEEDEQMAPESHPVGPETRQSFIGHNPFLEVPNPHCATEYKKGYVMRKCCVDPNGKRTPLGKRGWKMFYATLRDLVLYLHKDEHGFRKNQLYDSLHNSIRIHHALTTKATDYTKKQHVFRLQTADQAEYLFQTSDSKELQSWMDTINFVAASLSAPPLAGAVGSQKKFQRPLLPVSHTKLNLREQLQDHETRIMRLERELEEHLAHAPERGARSRLIHDFVEKEAYLQYELRRYRTYAFLLRSKMAQYPELEPPLVETSIGEVDEPVEKNEQTDAQPVHIIDRSSVKRSMSDRYSYRAAIYRNNFGDECG